jgi:DNA invertase Pin-like site-specific DNA recombinase
VKRSIPCEYADRESGAKRDRIEFQEMLRDAAHRRFDFLLFWSLVCSDTNELGEELVGSYL